MSILITAATDLQAYRFQRFLNEDTSFGDQLAFSNSEFIRLPDVRSASFIHEFLDVTLSNGFKTIFPLRFEEQKLLTEATQLFWEYEIRLFVPDISELQFPNKAYGKIDFLLIENGTPLKGNPPAGTSYAHKNGIYFVNDEDQLQPFYLC